MKHRKGKHLAPQLIELHLEAVHLTLRGPKWLSGEDPASRLSQGTQEERWKAGRRN